MVVFDRITQVHIILILGKTDSATVPIVCTVLAALMFTVATADVVPVVGTFPITVGSSSW